MVNKKIDILGREYEVCYIPADEDNMLKEEDLDGYTNFDESKIVIRAKDKFEWMAVAIRHEIIHAFMFESGLGFNWEHRTLMGHDETVIDWFAIQYPKIKSVFKKLGVD